MQLTILKREIVAKGNRKVLEFIITYVTDRKGHDLRYAIDPAKAMSELGWKPTTMFNDGIKLIIEWYKNHMDWVNECTGGEYQKYYDKMYKGR